MGIFSAIANALKAVASVFGYAKQRDAERNSPAMQANAAANTDAKISGQVAAAEDAAAQGDLSKIRNLAAE